MMRNVVLALLILIGSATAASAKPLYDTPVYYEANDSYFELVNLKNQYPGQFVRDESGWLEVKGLAAKRTYKGRRGRLAVVRDRATHEFLRDTFKPDKPSWFGLQYLCKYNRLIWANGRLHEKNGFQRWGRVWNVQGKRPNNPNRSEGCSNFNYFFAVHYWSTKSGFTWNANARNVHWKIMFVEYPPRDQYWK